MILLDTNVLVYATDELAPQHAESKHIVDAVIQGQVPGAIVPQILVEYLGVATGPTVASPLPAAEAARQVDTFRRQIRTLVPTRSALDELVEIVQATGRDGRRVFDYYLAAQARSLGIETICTYNGEDFAGIAGIRAATPTEVALATPEREL